MFLFLTKNIIFSSEQLKYRRLLSDAVPTIFTNLPTPIRKRVATKKVIYNYQIKSNFFLYAPLIGCANKDLRLF